MLLVLSVGQAVPSNIPAPGELGDLLLAAVAQRVLVMLKLSVCLSAGNAAAL